MALPTNKPCYTFISIWSETASSVCVAMSTDFQPIRLLHVDDEPSLTDLTADFLNRNEEQFHVTKATRPTDALELLAEAEFDCILSDYEMPRMDGIEFLRAVREEYPDLPFILYTSRGSETVAADAIAAGVTSYLQKESGTAQYSLLRNRIETHVEEYRTQQRAAELKAEYKLLAEVATDAFWVLDVAEDSIRFDGLETFGYEEYDPDREWWIERLHPDDRQRVLEADEKLLADDPTGFDKRTDDRGYFTLSYRWQCADGTYADCIEHGAAVFEDDEPIKLVGAMTDVSDR